MGDARRFWRESVGVLPDRPRREPARGPQEPARPRETSRAAPPQPAAPAEPPRPARAEPPLQLAPEERSIEGVLDGLSVGSLSFGNEVAGRLWSGPTAEDLARIATVAGARGTLRDRSVGAAVVRAVETRARFERGLRGGGASSCDPRRLAARSSELEALARRAEEIAADLRRGDAAEGAASAVARAALQLLPDPNLLFALAAHAAEMGSIVHLARQGRTSECWRPIPESTGLLKAVEVGRSGPGIDAALSIYTASLMALRDLEARPRDDLLIVRRLIAHVAVEADSARPARSASPDAAARSDSLAIAPWRRLLGDTRGRLDECLTRPARAPRPLSGAATRPPADLAALPHAAGSPAADEAILALMKAARMRARSADR